MQLRCHRPSLLAALQIVSGVVPSRTPKEVLKNVMLQVSSGKAVLIGTDQEVGIRQNVENVETDSSGNVLLPTTRVVSILRELQDDQVQLVATDRSLELKAGHSDFNLHTEDPAEFPPVPEFDEQNYFTVNAGSLREMIRRTVFATDTESTRYALGGIKLEANPEKLTLAATDSRRLAVVNGACEAVGEVGTELVEAVIPSKAMQLVEKSIPDSDEAVFVAVHSNDVVVKCGGSTIYSRLVEGRFPKFAEVIPNESNARVELVVSPFYSVVRQAQIVTNEESRGVDFTFAQGKLTVSSQAADVGQSSIEMPLAYDADSLTITFDPRFVADFLRILDGGTSVRLDLIDPESPAVFSTEDGYRYVVMPLSRES